MQAVIRLVDPVTEVADVDPSAARFGAAGGHATADIRTMSPVVVPVRLDAVISSGALGYRVDDTEGSARALALG